MQEHVDSSITDQAERQRWLLFIYRVPQDPPGRRTYIWRQLKQLGAVYLQQAAAVLPHTASIREALVALETRAREGDGDVSLLETTSPNQEWEQALVSRFNQARDEEYAEIIENIERCEDEISRESRKGKFTFAELEELEADWEKLQRWLERVRTRDFFDASQYIIAVDALQHARSSLETFTTTVYRSEGIASEPQAHRDERDT